LFSKNNDCVKAFFMHSVFIPTIIWRHHRENLRKCSLRGLEERPDFRFYLYPQDRLETQINHLDPNFLDQYLLLSVDAPPLTTQDRQAGLLLIDATWRYAHVMEQQLRHSFPPERRRSLPSGFITAYPRCQTACPDPARGLASIEALYIAYHLLERDTAGLLDSYYWREQFLAINYESLAKRF
jgi:pre-rRNA-processing protein TSR3